MAILIPAKALTGPQGGVTGVLGNILQGLSEGMPIGEQLKNQKRRTDLADQEMQLRTAEEKRRQGKEDSDSAAAALLSRYAALSAGELGAPDEQGQPAPSATGGAPFAPAAPNAPGGDVQGPATQGMSSGPVGPPPPQLLALLQQGQSQADRAAIPGQPGAMDAVSRAPLTPTQGNPAQTLPGRAPTGPVDQSQVAQQLSAGGAPAQGPPASPTAGVPGLHPHDKAAIDFVHGALMDPRNKFSLEDTQKILAAVHQDQSIRAVGQHAQRIAGDIAARMGHDAYKSMLPNGTEDTSDEEAAKANLDQLKNIDTSDPRAAAAIVDKVEQADAQHRQIAAQKRMMFESHQHMLGAFDAAVAERKSKLRPGEAASDDALQEIQFVKTQYQGGFMDDKEAGKALLDAQNGTYSLKKQKEQSDTENAQLKAENDRLNQILTKQKIVEGTPEAKAQAEADKLKNAQILKASPNAPMTPRETPGTPLSRIEAQAKIDEMRKAKYPPLEGGWFSSPTQEEQDAQEAKANQYGAQLQAQAFGQAPGRSSAPRAGTPPMVSRKGPVQAQSDTGANEAQGGQPAPSPKWTTEQKTKLDDLKARFAAGKITKEEAAAEIKKLGVE